MKWKCFGTAVVSVLVAAFFLPVLYEDKSFACRDVANFYYPLYEYTHSEMVAGRLPLWTPYENIGQPLAACPTSGVFYPLRLILFLPLEFRLKFHLFVVFHVVLATGTMFLLSSHLRCSSAASLYGAIGYSFGGIVLFQHTNLPFLIGAAWLPAVVLTAMKMVRGTWFHAICCGIFMTLMILAGDVETGCNFVLVTVILLVATAGVFLLKKMAITLLTAAGLSAVLLLPAIEFGLFSDRVMETSSAIFAEGRYHFSTSPWQWVELFVPNFYGRPFPQYSHWISWLTADDTYWVPTLYMGAVTPILAGVAVCTIFRTIFRKNGNLHSMVRFTDMCLPQRHREHRENWILAICVVLLLGLFFATPTGYYLLSQVVPVYSLFRYPGKWLVFVAMALNLLAAKGFDEVAIAIKKQRAGDVAQRNPPTMRDVIGYWSPDCAEYRYVRRSSFSFFASLATIILSLWLWSDDFWNTVATHIAPSTVFGPFQKNLAQSYCISGLLHSGTVLTLFVGWLLICPRLQYTRKTAKTLWQVCVILLLATDIYVANHWTVPVFSYPPTNAGGSLNPALTLGANAPKSQFFDAPRYMDQKIPLRVYRPPNWYPQEFVESSSPTRFQEVMDWNTATMSPKWNLRDRVNLVQVAGTFRCGDYTEWFRQQAKDTSGETVLQTLGVQKTLGVQGTISPDVTLETARKRTWIQDRDGTITADIPRIVRYEPERVVIDVCLTKSGVLVLSDQYYPGWQATVQYGDGDEEKVCHLPIIRVQEIFCGVELRDVGCYQVTFEYRPQSFYIGLAVTCVTLLILLVVLVFFYRYRFGCSSSV